MKLTRRNFLAAAGAGLTGSVLTGCPDEDPRPSPPEHPNILFILIDDMGNRVAGMGDPYSQTPNMDELIRTGVTFNNQFVQTASCGPARTALFTGMYPDTTHAWHNLVDFRDIVPDAITLPGQFGLNGYQTVPIWKVFHLGRHDDEALSWTRPSWRPEGSFPRYYNPGTSGRPPTEVGAVPSEIYHDAQVTQRAI